MSPLKDHRIPRDQGEPLVYPLDEPPQFGEVQEVTEGILWLRMPLIFDLNHINLYLLRDGDGWAILDTGLNTSMVRGMWEKVLDETLAGAPISRVIVTHYHPDHLGLAGWLCERTGAPLVMTGMEMMLARFLMATGRDAVPDHVLSFYREAGFDDDQLDFVRNMGYGNYSRMVSALPENYLRFRAGDKLTIGTREFDIRVGSGHSPEHACLYSYVDGILIAGDQMLPRITSNISVYPAEDRANPLKDWLDSLVAMKQLPVDTLVLPAHNEPFLGLHKRSDEMIDGHIRRLKSVHEMTKKGCAATDAFPALFKRKLKGFDLIMGLGESVAHLHYLEDIGLVERERAGDVSIFHASGKFDEMDVRLRIWSE
jgi:glyoxylase-like metal-dependent hydrolase (beta-lactamase superfamily II)